MEVRFYKFIYKLKFRFLLELRAVTGRLEPHLCNRGIQSSIPVPLTGYPNCGGHSWFSSIPLIKYWNKEYYLLRYNAVQPFEIQPTFRRKMSSSGSKNKPVNKRAWKQLASIARRLTFNGLHSVISQNIALFMTTSVRTSNPTNIITVPELHVDSVVTRGQASLTENEP
jgi:hypothetical protein